MATQMRVWRPAVLLADLPRIKPEEKEAIEIETRPKAE
jgi:hypothetical protein